MVDQQDHGEEDGERDGEEDDHAGRFEHRGDLIRLVMHRARMSVENDCGAACDDQDQRGAVILPNEGFAEVLPREDKVSDHRRRSITRHQSQVQIGQDYDVNDAG